MTTTYINNGEYRIDKFDNGEKFLLKRIYTDLNGKPIYDVVGQIDKDLR